MKKLLLFSASLFLFSLLGKATTVNSVCNGNWSSPNTWNTEAVPSSTDTINVFHNVILDINVNVLYPGKLIIDTIGSVCGNKNFTGGFIGHGILMVDTLRIESYSITYAGATSIFLTVDSTFTVVNWSCVGCPPAFGLPLPCHPIGSYTVNSAVYDTLNSVYVAGDTTYGVCYPQYSQDVFISPSVFPYASGVKLYFLINNINAVASSVTSVPGGIVQVGDTLPLPTTNPSGGYQFSFSQGGSIQLYLIAIGTPNSQGQTYACGWNSIVKTYKYCQDSIIFYPDTTANCTTRMQATSINNKYIKDDISIYPNPTSDQFFIDANTTAKLSVDLYDVEGRHVYNASVSDKSNINVADLNVGVYNLTIKMTDRIINKKLVILR